MAGILLLERSTLEFPSKTESTKIVHFSKLCSNFLNRIKSLEIHGDMNCPLASSQPIFPFAFRTHTHKLGVVLSGYKLDENDEFVEIGKGNPQWPQAFYPVQNKNITILPNDYVVARCTYSTMNIDQSMSTFWKNYYDN